MKFKAASVRLVLAPFALACLLSVAGCGQDEAFGTARRDPIGPAPTGLPTAGIGAPGGSSADTRAIGSVAASEGQATEGAPAVGVGTTSSTHR